MDKEFKKTLAKERWKWGIVVLLNVVLILVFPPKNNVFDVFPIQSFLRGVQPNHKIVTSIIAGDIGEDSGDSGQ
ncbi:hypothetical protein P872_23975 [Rhodonellum psychrophilum GCM71 = DSM 17998]|uniref:Uncharacterized protein n=2 Tax=Rhodonellum TaxID=336827 RepID=U5BVU9_9BACT|nr:hypothetical protein [Rhodonellum psychrophilum]ERM84770.1 hypothetical protein P872_23975 [Rhodonellum psychrophilum GCM71 = DSM 17998]MDO9551308.1 hypothetical protein [Rhodonellum sp.]SDZ11682.1 hypothetical protein SAMN05444412_10642 [Rhodonellum ikkaensis]